MADDSPRFVQELTATVGWSMTPPPPVVNQQVLSLFDQAFGHSPDKVHATAARVLDRESLLVRDDDTASHRVYSSDIADVTIRVDGGVLTGQVLPIVRPTPAAFAVTVVDGPTRARSYEGDEAGSFQLPALEPGTYRLLLDNTHLEIELTVDVEDESPWS